MHVAVRKRSWFSSRNIEESSPRGTMETASLKCTGGVQPMGYSSLRKKESGRTASPAMLATKPANVECGHQPRHRHRGQPAEYHQWAASGLPVTPPRKCVSSTLAGPQSDATVSINGGLGIGMNHREDVHGKKTENGGDLTGCKASMMSITVQISPRNPLDLVASGLPPSAPRSGAGLGHRMIPQAPVSPCSMSSPSDQEEPTVIRQWYGSVADSGCETEENFTSSDDEVADIRNKHRSRNVVDEFFASGSCVTTPGIEDGIGSQKGSGQRMGFEDLVDDAVSPEIRRAKADEHCFVLGSLAKGTQIGRNSRGIESSTRVNFDITEEKTVEKNLNNSVHAKTTGAPVVNDHNSKNKHVQPDSSSFYDSAHQLDMQDRRVDKQKITQTHRACTKSLQRTLSIPSTAAGHQGRSTGNVGAEDTPRCFFSFPGITDVLQRMSSKLQLQRKEKKSPMALGNAAEGEETRLPKHKLRYMKRQETIRNVIEDSLKTDRKRNPKLERKSRREPVIFQPIHDSVQDLDEVRNMITSREWAASGLNEQVVA